MVLHEGFGFNYLSHLEKQAYIVVLKALSTKANSFSIANIDRSVDIMKIVQTVLGDNPSVVYFNKTQLQIEESAIGRKIILSGVPSKAQIQNMSSELITEADRVASFIKSSQKVRNDSHSLLIKLYEYLQSNVKYDMTERKANAKGLSPNPHSHNAYGALINRVAVCDGFSSAFTLLSQKLGFECMLAIGYSAYESASSVNHAWNIVKIQGRCYHMDITWDARKYEEFQALSYVYFAVNDDEIKADHDWDKSTTPVCSFDDFSYYNRNGIFARNAQELSKMIKAAGKRDDKLIRVKVSQDVGLGEKSGEKLAQMYINEVAKPGTGIQVCYGWNEKARCFFAKIV